MAALLLGGCGSTAQRIDVSATGRIGPLRIDKSDRAAVISFVGKPESERRGSYAHGPPFDALGYGCNGKEATDAAGVPRCTTVFYLDVRTGRLALLYTEDPRYVETHGVHPRTRTSVAERRLHLRPFAGCFSGYRFETKKAFLVLWLEGGKKLVGDRVGFLVVHSKRLNPGVLDCIDS